MKDRTRFLEITLARQGIQNRGQQEGYDHQGSEPKGQDQRLQAATGEERSFQLCPGHEQHGQCDREHKVGQVHHVDQAGGHQDKRSHQGSAPIRPSHRAIEEQHVEWKPVDRHLGQVATQHVPRLVQKEGEYEPADEPRPAIPDQLCAQPVHGQAAQDEGKQDLQVVDNGGGKQHGEGQRHETDADHREHQRMPDSHGVVHEREASQALARIEHCPPGPPQRPGVLVGVPALLPDDHRVETERDRIGQDNRGQGIDEQGHERPSNARARDKASHETQRPFHHPLTPR